MGEGIAGQVMAKKGMVWGGLGDALCIDGMVLILVEEVEGGLCQRLAHARCGLPVLTQRLLFRAHVAGRRGWVGWLTGCRAGRNARQRTFYVSSGFPVVF